MTEDSGAFKTNLRIRAGFRHNIMIRTSVAGMPQPLEKRRPWTSWPLQPRIFNNRTESVAVILESA
jgi:hypothetical protein